MSLRVTGAELVWTGTREVPGGTVVCAGDRVAGEAPGPVDELDASGCVVTPGLVNAHHHLLQSAFRTRPDARHVPMREWLGNMAAAYWTVGVDPELCGAAAGVALAEGLLCGVTTVADHHLTWPAGADHTALVRATVAAAAGLGGRLVFVRGTAGDDPSTAAGHAEELAGALGVGPGGVAPDGMVQLAVGPAGVHSDGAETFRLLGEVASRHGLRRRTQAGEQVDVERAAERYGRRPLDLLDEWGWIGPDVTLAHLCGITAAEADRLAAAGVTATHAPGCDLPSGWGVAPVAALRDRGVVVGLGTSVGQAVSGRSEHGLPLAGSYHGAQTQPVTPL